MEVQSATAPDAQFRGATSGKLAAWSALVAVLIAIGYAGNLTSSASQRSAEDALYKYSTAVGGCIEYALWLGLILWISRRDRGLLGLRRPDSWPRALGLALLALVGTYLAVRIMDPFLHAGREQGLVPKKWQPAHEGAFAANWVIVAGIDPIVEELTFRGLGFSLLYARWGKIVAIVLVGILFAAAHGLVQALPELATLGCALAWLRWRTRSVYPGMLVHALFNSLALISVIAGG